MAAETSSFKIERLNGKNFQTWKFNMKCLLMERGLWGFVTGTVVKPIKLEVVEGETTATDVAKNIADINQYELRSDKAFSTIAMCMEPDLQVHVASKTTAKEAWESLKCHFEFVSVTQVVRLTRRFYSAKMEEGGDLMKHITEMTSLAEQLREMNEEVSSKKFAITMLGSLPDSYDNFLTSMNARAADQLEWSSVKGVLVEEYMKREDRETQKQKDDALFTRDRGRGRSRGRGRGRGASHDGRGASQDGRHHPYKPSGKFEGTCFSCGESGHKYWSPECPKYQQKSSEEEHAKLAYHESDMALLCAEETAAVVDDDDNNNKASLCDESVARVELPVVNNSEDVCYNSSVINVCNVSGEASIETQSLTSCEESSSVNSDVALNDEAVGDCEIALVSSCDYVETSTTNCEWYVDSGATNHMTNDVNILSDVDYHEKPTPVYLGDKSVVLSHAVGKLRLKTACSDGACLALSYVLFVPKIVKNLLSVRSMTKQGAEVRFKGDKCVVVKNDRHIQIGSSINGGLYVFKSCVVTPQSAYISSVPPPEPPAPPPPPPATAAVPKPVASTSTLSLWHQRYGHLNMNDLKRMSRNDDVVVGMKVDQKVHFYDDQCCEPCALGKMHRLPFPKQSLNRASRELEIVHTDLCGPMQVESMGGSRYMLTFTDDFSRYTVVYFLKKKSEVLSKFVEYVNFVENKNKHHLKQLNVINCIRSDNGGEYTSSDFAKYCSGKGISRQFTNPHSPQQNGVSERMNRTIMEGARSMLYQAKLPLKFWAEAVSTMVYLRNRSPTTSLNGSTPYEFWFKQKPDVSNLRVFGCVCYVHIPDACRRKLDPKSYKAVFLGYPDGTKGYKVLNISKETFNRSHSVLFHEQSFHDFKCGSMKDLSNEMLFPVVDIVRSSGSSEPSDNDQVGVDREVIPPNPVEIAPPPVDEIEREVIPPNPPNPVEIAPPPVDVENNDAPRNAHRVKSTYEDTFLDQVANLDPVRIRKPPTRFVEEDTADLAFDTCCLASLVSDLDEPKSFKQAAGGKNAEKWNLAMSDEFNSLMVNQTWELVPRPVDQNVIGCRWVYKIKRGADGSITRHKARLVAQGYTQTEGVDYEEVFAPVAHAATIRTLLSFANTNNFEVHQMDVRTAFLHGVLDCVLFMEQPEGFVDPDKPDYVCKLNKGLYGLKQAARCWNETLDKHLIDSGFVKGSADSCIYVKVLDKSFVIMAVYVDDIIPVSNDSTLLAAEKAAICQQFEMEDNGPIDYFLGMYIKRDRDKRILSISQPKYINDVLVRFGMSDCKPVATPIEPGVKYDKLGEDDEPFDVRTYQQGYFVQKTL